MLRKKMHIGWRQVAVLFATLTLTLITVTPDMSRGEDAKQKIETLELLCPPVGTSTYAMGFAFTQVLKKKHPWFRLSAVETPGFVYMVKTTNKRPKEVFSTAGSLECGVKLGRIKQSDFSPKNEIAGILKLKPLLKDMRGLVNSVVSCGFFVTFDPKIKTPKDMIGKTIGLGKVTQSYYSLMPYMFLKEGWGIADQVVLRNISPMGAADALIDGLVDVAFVSAGMGLTNGQAKPIAALPPLMKLIATGRDLKYIKVEKQVVERLNQATGWHLPALLIPAGSLKHLDVDTYAISTAYGFGCHKDMPEKYAYEFTKFWVNNTKALAKAHALGKLLTPEISSFGYIEEGLHPGAVRAYRELGIPMAK